jgi:cellulose synthase/poly-beta-1,6-N-acetylglucosamine synthase-like glycosyltransferase
MSVPLVSVCLPSLNTFPFLQERIDTIFGQTFEDWELVVTDSYSDDGSWEFFERLARKDPRVSIAQAPRGLYPGWNHCLQRARGEYVYVATSDDTMALDCLQKMVTALETSGECDLAHCPLVNIDGHGARLNDSRWHRWPENTPFARGLEELAWRPHIRRAPYVGLIHLVGEHVVLSVNQLLIRRSLFERTGYFSSQWGSEGDFNWEMRACLVANMVHVPDTWASLRLHSSAASATVNMFSAQRTQKVEEMIQDALGACEPMLPQRVVDGLKADWLAPSRQLRGYYAGLRERPGVVERRLFQLERFLAGGHRVRSEMLKRTVGAPRWTDAAPARLRTWLETVVGEPVIDVLT